MLETLDLKKTISKAAYSRQMDALQEKMRKLQYAANEAKIATTICLEGWDLSGKGTVIRKLTERLDPRLFRVYPGTPPSSLERRYHFLWRYQVKLPNYGETAVFDHSWYSRVLVERMDKLTKKRVWREAFQQIEDFERWLVDDGQVLIKFWLQISKKEQKMRFRASEQDPLLRWKITKEYKRHHRQYEKWTVAVEEMLVRTSTAYAPWTLVEAEDTRWARVKVFQTIVSRLEETLAKRQKLATVGKKKSTSSPKRKPVAASHKKPAGVKAMPAAAAAAAS
ncbi:MAG: polyphosphate kinase 2 family protein [Candidatus Acidiferrales bacterium]